MSFTIRGIHVFWAIFAFFVVIIAMDAFFVVRAVGSFPGEIVPNSYIQGLDYNRTLERQEKQRQLGWLAAAGFEGADAQMFVVRLQSEPGAPISGLEVAATLHVSGDRGESAPVRLVQRAPGEYVVHTNVRGHRIEAEITASRPGDAGPAFKAEKILVLP